MSGSELDAVRAQWQQLQDALAPPAGIPEYRVGFDKMCEQFPIPSDATITEIDAAGVGGLRVRSATASGDATVLWAHSGGYVFGSPLGYRSFGASLSAAAGAQVALPDYRLAPENPYPAALEDMVAAYRWLLDSGHRAEDVVVGGDSAGGGLAAATVLAIGERGLPRPAGAVFVSPVADQTFSGESMTTRAALDPIASQEMLDGLGSLYRGDTPREHPHISPLFGDWSGAPPLLVLVGTDEVLHDDAVRLVARAGEAGSAAELVVGEGQFHIYPLFASMLTEGQAALDRIGRFVAEHTSTTDTR